ncbi:hypothetical protein NEUTE1DRAFT_38634 [Neurospora tetrasperma FGSC 2508]|uniref:Uncharacterized protein n=1 Tax=Neurospora tetrasperma (strain FGSC 2508 / ATCC MYA-4615 / P0657) TaxID=510951 RepID=F8MHB6_NEUT8|nr:uncharacterized protein NEUTE1DRAFT_38634 [Neurospora tetrasperma FGSC 2508]EGO59579.1 hypothetical protein NEUTE1DRAFT_38634 [Neurospora tetrasperma FGSC 2508]EGZ73707.1 hypothetical protein NEUTE2DRAFT_128058 [Neurospora tetrasperma FGSC 2509]
MQRMTEGKIIYHITINVNRRQRVIKIKLSDVAVSDSCQALGLDPAPLLRAASVITGTDAGERRTNQALPVNGHHVTAFLFKMVMIGSDKRRIKELVKCQHGVVTFQL